MPRAPGVLERLTDGPIGAITSTMYVEQQLARIEAAVAVLEGSGMSLEQIERLACGLKKAWVANLLRLDRHREEIE